MRRYGNEPPSETQSRTATMTKKGKKKSPEKKKKRNKSAFPRKKPSQYRDPVYFVFFSPLDGSMLVVIIILMVMIGAGIGYLVGGKIVGTPSPLAPARAGRETHARRSNSTIRRGYGQRPCSGPSLPCARLSAKRRSLVVAGEWRATPSLGGRRPRTARRGRWRCGPRGPTASGSCPGRRAGT